MQARGALLVGVGISALAVTACGGGDGPPASDDATGDGPSTGASASATMPPIDDATSTATTDEPTTTSPPTTADASSTGDPGGLPDYADSPCWGDAATTPVYDGTTHMLDDVAVTCRAEGRGRDGDHGAHRPRRDHLRAERALRAAAAAGR